MSTSLVYRSAAGYELLMRLLYGRHYGARMRMVAEQVRPGASVLELCPGPGALYERHLRGRAGDYTALELNPGFVARLRGLGARASVVDLSSDDRPLPPADVVIMQASLYHFLPHADSIVDRMLAAARERVVVAEPIRNLSSSTVPIVARLGQRGADPGAGEASHADRFTELTLERLMTRYEPQIAAAFKIPGGREKVYVLDPRRS